MIPNLDKKIFAGVLAGLFVGLILAPALRVPVAQANLFQDFWNNFVGPFDSQTTRPTQGIPSFTDNSTAQSYQTAVNYEQAVIVAVKKASPAVVSITISKYVPIIEQCPYSPFQDLPPEFQQFFGRDNGQFYAPCDTGKKQLQEIGGGSGFIISSNGLILTNKHVVADKNASYTVLTNDGKKYDAKVLARDPIQDLAVVKIEASNLPTVELGDSSGLELGQTAIAIGNALGEFRNTVSVGVVSGLARTITASGVGLTETIQGLIQTDAAINPGNSGGPLLNLQGQVVGIDTAVAAGAQNIGFAIPINQAKRDIDSVRVNGDIEIPFLGVRYQMVTPDLAKNKKLPVDYGALVGQSKDGPAVQPGSPADKAGVKNGDIIIEANGQKISDSHTLGDVISNLNVGQTVSLKINRGGKEIVSNAVLEKRPDNL